MSTVWEGAESLGMDQKIHPGLGLGHRFEASGLLSLFFHLVLQESDTLDLHTRSNNHLYDPGIGLSYPSFTAIKLCVTDGKTDIHRQKVVCPPRW